MSNWQWLESTFRLQRDVYKYPLDLFVRAAISHPNSWELNQLSEYIDWNLTAAGQELAEAREEISWKPWAIDDPFVHRDRVRDEIIDAMHFLGNILTSIGVTDEELAENYQIKQELNRRRHESGSYSAKKGGLSKGSDIE